MYKTKINVLLAGGSTGGPVSPLIAVAKELEDLEPDVHFRFLLVGPKSGPAEQMAKYAGIKFQPLPEAKLRRYFSPLNLFMPFKLLAAFIKSAFIISRFKPDLIFGAGGFTQVPLVFVGKFLRVPSVIHQQDVQVSLSNQLCSMFAAKITTSFEESLTAFPQGLFLSELKSVNKVVFTGNPANLPSKLPNREAVLKSFGLDADIPVLLVVGGGTGAKFLNKLVYDSLAELTKYFQILLVTGKGKIHDLDGAKNSRLKVFEFLTNVPEALSVADIVVARAGLSTITELSKYAKPSIIIPLPNTHQEFNAMLLYDRKAAIVVDQSEFQRKKFLEILRKFAFDFKLQKKITKNISELMPHDASKRVAKVIWKVLIKDGA